MFCSESRRCSLSDSQTWPRRVCCSGCDYVGPKPAHHSVFFLFILLVLFVFLEILREMSACCAKKPAMYRAFPSTQLSSASDDRLRVRHVFVFTSVQQNHSVRLNILTTFVLEGLTPRQFVHQQYAKTDFLTYLLKLCSRVNSSEISDTTPIQWR